MKKAIFLFLVGLFGLIFLGCATAKGTADAAKSIGGGLCADALTIPAAVMKTDEWIKKNMW